MAGAITFIKWFTSISIPIQWQYNAANYKAFIRLILNLVHNNLFCYCIERQTWINMVIFAGEDDNPHKMPINIPCIIHQKQRKQQLFPTENKWKQVEDVFGYFYLSHTIFDNIKKSESQKATFKETGVQIERMYFKCFRQ